MPRNKTTEIITVLGQSGSGKSSWVQKHLKSLSRFLLWDTLGEYTGFQTFTEIEELYEYMMKNHRGFFQLVFNCLTDSELEDFETCCEMVRAVEDCFFIVEEVDQYATPMQMPFELRTLLKIGRHSGVSMIFVSRRPAEINRLVTAQSRRFICFQMLEPGDIRFMKSIIGDVAETLRDLPKLHFIDWNHGQIERGEITWNEK